MKLMNHENNVFKSHELTINISPQTRSNIVTNTTFFSMDVNTGKKIINFTHENSPVDLTDATVLLGFEFVGAGTSKIIDSEDGSVVIEDAVNGQCSVNLPNHLYQYEGQVLVHVYLQYTDGRSLDCGVIVTEFSESWLDSDLEKMAEFYVRRFENMADEIKSHANAIFIDFVAGTEDFKKNLETTKLEVLAELTTIKHQVLDGVQAENAAIINELAVTKEDTLSELTTKKTQVLKNLQEESTTIVAELSKRKNAILDEFNGVTLEKMDHLTSMIKDNQELSDELRSRLAKEMNTVREKIIAAMSDNSENGLVQPRIDALQGEFEFLKKHINALFEEGIDLTGVFQVIYSLEVDVQAFQGQLKEVTTKFDLAKELIADLQTEVDKAAVEVNTFINGRFVEINDQLDNATSKIDIRLNEKSSELNARLESKAEIIATFEERIEALKQKVVDTGWVALDAGGHNVANRLLQARRIGDVVHLQGAVGNITEINGNALLTLPEIFTPAFPVNFNTGFQAPYSENTLNGVMTADWFVCPKTSELTLVRQSLHEAFHSEWVYLIHVSYVASTEIGITPEVDLLPSTFAREVFEARHSANTEKDYDSLGARLDALEMSIPIRGRGATIATDIIPFDLDEHNVEGDLFQFKRVGPVLYLQGSMKSVEENTIVCKLPEGFRPKSTIYLTTPINGVEADYGVFTMDWQISPNGDIKALHSTIGGRLESDFTYPFAHSFVIDEEVYDLDVDILPSTFANEIMSARQDFSSLDARFANLEIVGRELEQVGITNEFADLKEKSASLDARTTRIESRLNRQTRYRLRFTKNSTMLLEPDFSSDLNVFVEINNGGGRWEIFDTNPEIIWEVLDSKDGIKVINNYNVTGESVGEVNVSADVVVGTVVMIQATWIAPEDSIEDSLSITKILEVIAPPEELSVWTDTTRFPWLIVKNQGRFSMLMARWTLNQTRIGDAVTMGTTNRFHSATGRVDFPSPTSGVGGPESRNRMRLWWHRLGQVSPELRASAVHAEIPTRTAVNWVNQTNMGVDGYNSEFLSFPIATEGIPDNPLFFPSEAEIVLWAKEATNLDRIRYLLPDGTTNPTVVSPYFIRSRANGANTHVFVDTAGNWSATNPNTNHGANAGFRPCVWIDRSTGLLLQGLTPRAVVMVENVSKMMEKFTDLLEIQADLKKQLRGDTDVE